MYIIFPSQIPVGPLKSRCLTASAFITLSESLHLVVLNARKKRLQFILECLLTSIGLEARFGNNFGFREDLEDFVLNFRNS